MCKYSEENISLLSNADGEATMDLEEARAMLHKAIHELYAES